MARESETIILIASTMMRRAAITAGAAVEGASLEEAKHRFLRLKETAPLAYKDMLMEATEILSELDRADLLK